MYRWPGFGGKPVVFSNDVTANPFHKHQQHWTMEIKQKKTPKKIQFSNNFSGIKFFVQLFAFLTANKEEISVPLHVFIFSFNSIVYLSFSFLSVSIRALRGQIFYCPRPSTSTGFCPRPSMSINFCPRPSIVIFVQS